MTQCDVSCWSEVVFVLKWAVSTTFHQTLKEDVLPFMFYKLFIWTSLWISALHWRFGSTASACRKTSAGISDAMSGEAMETFWTGSSAQVDEGHVLNVSAVTSCVEVLIQFTSGWRTGLSLSETACLLKTFDKPRSGRCHWNEMGFNSNVCFWTSNS